MCTDPAPSFLPLVLCAMLCAFGACAEMTLSTPDGAVAQFEAGALVSFADAQGRVFVQDHRTPTNPLLRHLSNEAAPGQVVVEGDTEICTEFEGVPGARVTNRYTVENNRFTITQEAATGEPGLWGISMQVAHIPLDRAILIPGRSGIRLDRLSPGREHLFDYPMEWEAQFVLIEDDAGHGLCISAEDFNPRKFKRLVVTRESEGWRLQFVAMPFAPFTSCASWGPVQWHIRPYEGGFREGAAEYRKALLAAAQPELLENQQPAWVDDIGTVVITDLSLDRLDTLAALFDPTKVMLYVPGWRQAGYDRDYPTYDQPVPELAPFIEHAHALGFRVMLHANYFGCQADHPAYTEMEPYHLRSAWGDHAEQWWLWDRVEPEIRFAYINPAYKGWRDLLVREMVRLCEQYKVDALHIDQTLVIQNDHNGLIDGMSMIDGAMAIHRELRAALPQVALSGEGLNEVTFPFEAFAQRHAWGIQHTDQTFNRKELATAHPISSFLFRPYTGIYGYLGIASPANGQLYAAWQEAYRHWGVIPALSLAGLDTRRPTGFVRQAFEEMRFWQEAGLRADVDGPWPADVAFPFLTRSGQSAFYTKEGRLLEGHRTISHIVSGVTEIPATGSIPGWPAYDDTHLFGLDPEKYYPCFNEPSDLTAFHVSALPSGFTVGGVHAQDQLTTIETLHARSVTIRLADQLAEMHTGTRLSDGTETECLGELFDANGGTFTSGPGGFAAHPPWQGGVQGVTWARFQLPGLDVTSRFIAEVALRTGAVGPDRSDGVTFRVIAHCGEQTLTQEILHADSEPATLTLDLAPFQGQPITLELVTDPGPQQNPSYDWSLWNDPRIEPTGQSEGAITLETPGGGWRVLLTDHNALELDPQQETHQFTGLHPGIFYLLKERPGEITIPCDLSTWPFLPSFTGLGGSQPDSLLYASAEQGAAMADGIERHGFSMHPPFEGQTHISLPMVLPDTPVCFTAYAGLREGAIEGHVRFEVRVNGRCLGMQDASTPGWQLVECDLSPWCGKPIVLDLVVDSLGTHSYDWAYWTEPRLLPGPAHE